MWSFLVHLLHMAHDALVDLGHRHHISRSRHVVLVQTLDVETQSLHCTSLVVSMMTHSEHFPNECHAILHALISDNFLRDVRHWQIHDLLPDAICKFLRGLGHQRFLLRDSFWDPFRRHTVILSWAARHLVHSPHVRPIASISNETASRDEQRGREDGVKHTAETEHHAQDTPLGHRATHTTHTQSQTNVIVNLSIAVGRFG